MCIPGVKTLSLDQLFLLLVYGHTWTWQKLPESHVPYKEGPYLSLDFQALDSPHKTALYNESPCILIRCTYS